MWPGATDPKRGGLVSKPPSPWRAALDRWVRIIQGNFDHFDHVIKQFQEKHNNLDDNVQALVEFVNDNLETLATDAEEVIAGLPTTYVEAHDDLTGVTADQHHAQDHDHDGTPTQQLDAANTHGSPSPDTHHAQTHDIDGADHNGFPGGSTDFLREDGTWATPPGGSGSDGSDHDVLDHADANTSPSPTSGDVLTWDGAEWVADAPTGGGADNLSDLTDVDTTVDSATGGESLVYNGGASQWQAQTLNNRLDGLADVAVTEGPGIDTYALTWDDGLSSWVASAAGTGPPGDPGGGVTFVFASRVHPVTGIGRRAYLDRDVTIDHVYAWSTDSTPSGTFECDVLLNDVSIFTGSLPQIDPGDYLGAPVIPTTTSGVEYDKLEVEFTNIGGVDGRVFVAVVCHV